jgi:hypothetical protein
VGRRGHRRRGNLLLKLWSRQTSWVHGPGKRRSAQSRAPRRARRALDLPPGYFAVHEPQNVYASVEARAARSRGATRAPRTPRPPTPRTRRSSGLRAGARSRSVMLTAPGQPPSAPAMLLRGSLLGRLGQDELDRLRSCAYGVSPTRTTRCCASPMCSLRYEPCPVKPRRSVRGPGEALRARHGASSPAATGSPSTRQSPSLPPRAPRTRRHLRESRPAEPLIPQRSRVVGATGFEPATP